MTVSRLSPVPSPYRVLCLMGPTAAGKSAATLALAQRWPIEIINVDSATIYRGMDIGTAKPNREEQASTPHHLLDILDPTESYSVNRFCETTRDLIEAIRARGRIPVLAGGTMMYFKALRDGLDDLPRADVALRAELSARAEQVGWPALHAELARLDPTTAARLSVNDSQRIQRALEVCLLSGQAMSELLGRQSQTPDPIDWVAVSLEPSDRSALHTRIAARFDLMLDAGLVDEVRALHRREDLHPGLPSIRCVGYRQVWSYLEREIDAALMRDQAIAATRQLAKRQITWLRSTPQRQAIDCLAPTAVSQLIDTVVPLMQPTRL